MTYKWAVIITSTIAILVGVTLLKLNQESPATEQVQSIANQKPLVSNPTIIDIEIKRITANSSKSSGKSNPALIEKQIPETQLTGQLRQHLNKLLARYKAGDLAAGYVLAMNLEKCSSVDDKPDDFADNINSLYENHKKGMYSDKDLVSLKQQMESKFHFCDGVSMEVRKQYFKYLSATAEQGYPPSQVMYGLISPPNLIGDVFANLSKSQQSQQVGIYRDKANQYLKSAAQTGSVRSMIFMVGNLRFGKGKNLIKALAYNLALLDLTTHNGLHNDYTDIRHALEKEMTFEEIELANSQSITIINTVIKNGIIYRI